ncbi:MAG: flippase-like domain-containing protein [Clostridiales bacterium]|nr:flippase-like domain-containing protein [Clostridiales bacterium]
MIVYILANTDFRLIWLHLREVPLPLAALLLSLQLVTQMALNLQWYLLSRNLNLKTSFLQLFVINAYGTLTDAVTPGEKVGGEVVRIIQFKRILKYSANQSTSLVAIQKSVSVFSLVLLNFIALLTLSKEISFLESDTTRAVLIVISAVLALFFLSLLFFTERLNILVQKMNHNGNIGKGVKRWMQGFTRDTKLISRHPGRWIQQLLLSLGIWALFPLKLFILVSHYASVNPLVLFAITFVSYFAAMIPLLPGGLGTFDSIMSGLLLINGLAIEEALAISLIFRFVTFWFVVLISVLIVFLWKVFTHGRKKAYEGQ